jgi:hypothetical protein
MMKKKPILTIELWPNKRINFDSFNPPQEPTRTENKPVA